MCKVWFSWTTCWGHPFCIDKLAQLKLCALCHVEASVDQYLHKQRYGLHAGNLSSVYRISSQNVKSSCATFDYFLHTNTILVTDIEAAKKSLLKKQITIQKSQSTLYNKVKSSLSSTRQQRWGKTQPSVEKGRRKQQQWGILSKQLQRWIQTLPSQKLVNKDVGMFQSFL